MSDTTPSTQPAQPPVPDHEPEGRNRGLSRSLGWTILVLALPVLGEQFCNIFVGLFDTFLAGRVDKEALAAVGLASYVAWLATMLSGFVGIGATALVARSVGAGDPQRANRFTNQAMGVAGFLGLALSVGLLVLAPLLPRLMGLTEQASQVATQYLRIDAIGQFIYCYMLIGAACLRGAGDTRTPMLVIVFINVVNVMVSATLVLGLGPVPELGVVGIVIGTLTARSLGGMIMLWILIRGRSGLKLLFRRMKPQREPVLRLLNIGGPAGLDAALMWTGNFIFLSFISRVAADPEIGLAAYAAHIVGVRIASFSYLPAMAWGIAAATLVGQALGAGDPDRARRTGHLAVLQMLPLGIVLVLLYHFGAGLIYACWSNDAAVAAQGIPALRLVAFFQPFLMTQIIYVSALRGAGDTRFPLLFTIVGVYCFRIPLAYLFGVTLQGGLIGAWIGMSADFCLRSLLAAWRFTFGRWTEKTI